MSPFDMKAFIDGLGSPYIGAYFDVGNVVVTSAPEHWIEILGSRIFKIHVKDYKREGRIYSGGMGQSAGRQYQLGQGYSCPPVGRL